MVYRFDDFTLDTATRRLLRAGAERHLSPKAFDLLNFLVANRARAISKTELLQQLWPTTHVLETNLASLVAEIGRPSRILPRIHDISERCIGSAIGAWDLSSPRRDLGARCGAEVLADAGLPDGRPERR